MSNEDYKNRGYRAYLVRLWPVHSGGQTVWRASAEDAHSGERHAFADLAHLFAFLQEATLSPKENETLSDKTNLQNKEHPDD